MFQLWRFGGLRFGCMQSNKGLENFEGFGENETSYLNEVFYVQITIKQILPPTGYNKVQRYN